MKDDSLSYISNDVTLKINETYKIKLGFANNISLMYAGMSSKDFFSIVIIEGSGYQGFSYNLYYPKDSTSIKVKKKPFSILNVSEDSITIREQ